MTAERLRGRFAELAQHPPPDPGGGHTAERHRRLMDVGREDMSLARLVEAHWDAVAILHEAGREPVAGALYGVWAAEKPGERVVAQQQGSELHVSGTKPFCSGSGLVTHALVTVFLHAEEAAVYLLDLDLTRNRQYVRFDRGTWATAAFEHTGTATAHFAQAVAAATDFVSGADWYLTRSGFWHGACGPAAAWAGGALGVWEWAQRQSRRDPHTLAHLGGLYADAWTMRAVLTQAGDEIDAAPADAVAARIRARAVRHTVEQLATDMLTRLGRAYGPHPLCMDAEMSRRAAELTLYLRQSHAERDLEALGADVTKG